MATIFYQALLLTIFHSIWQSAILFGLYSHFKGKGKKTTALYRRNNLLLLLFAQTFISIFSFSFAVSAKSAVQFNPGPLESFSGYTQLLFPILTMLYAFGVLLYFAKMIRSLYSSQESFRQESIECPAELLTIFNAVCSRFPYKNSIRISLHKSIQSPMVVGILKPAILFPVALVNRLSVEQIEALLVHELSHIKNNDPLINVILVLIESVFFFNPFVKRIAKAIRIEREQACDEAVLNRQYSPLVYAEALLHTASNSRKNILRLAAAGNHDLAERIALFTEAREEKRADKRSFIFLILGIFLLGGFIAMIDIFYPGNNRINDFVQEEVPVFTIKTMPEEKKEIKDEVSTSLMAVDLTLAAPAEPIAPEIKKVEYPEPTPPPTSESEIKVIPQTNREEPIEKISHDNHFAYVANFDETSSESNDEIIIEEIEQSGKKQIVAYRITRSQNGDVTLTPIVQLEEKQQKPKAITDSSKETATPLKVKPVVIEVYPTVQ